MKFLVSGPYFPHDGPRGAALHIPHRAPQERPLVSPRVAARQIARAPSAPASETGKISSRVLL